MTCDFKKYAAPAIVAIVTILSIGAANAASCAQDIEKFQNALPRDENGDPTFVGTARQSIAAQLEHQPTPISVERAKKDARSRNPPDTGSSPGARFSGETGRMQRGDGAGENFAQSLTERQGRPAAELSDDPGAGSLLAGGIPAPCFTRQLADNRSALSTPGIIRRRSEFEFIARTKLGEPSGTAGERKRDGTCQAGHFSRSTRSN